jgi:hypothetical protein
MAAVLALIAVPLLAAIGFFTGACRTDATLSSMFAMALFFALGAGVLVGTLRLISNLEQEGDLS